jgi:hypothetical protein
MCISALSDARSFVQAKPQDRTADGRCTNTRCATSQSVGGAWHQFHPAVQHQADLPATQCDRLHDQGITAAFKAYYWHKLVAWILEEANKPCNQGRSLKDLTRDIF